MDGWIDVICYRDARTLLDSRMSQQREELKSAKAWDNPHSWIPITLGVFHRLFGRCLVNGRLIKRGGGAKLPDTFCDALWILSPCSVVDPYFFQILSWPFRKQITSAFCVPVLSAIENLNYDGGRWWTLTFFHFRVALSIDFSRPPFMTWEKSLVINVRTHLIWAIHRQKASLRKDCRTSWRNFPIFWAMLN